MPIEVACPKPGCKKRQKVPSASAGKSVRCKACRETFIATHSPTLSATDVFEPAWDAAPRHTSTVAAPAPAGSIGRFVIRGRLGSGAFGTVYRAYDPQLDRVVALKVPNPGVMADARRMERFLREAKAAANLRHPHIVPVFDAGRDGDQFYIASAFIDGKPLADTIEEKGTDFTRAARLTRELAEALAYAHGEGTVHRDVKPVNIMLDKQDRVHLMDFGLAARQEEERLTFDGAVVGTPSYMAPEQAAGQKGEAQPAADQYAVGVVLYELLTGTVPFTGPTTVVIHNVIHTAPDSPRKHRTYIPKDLETICLKAMAKRPEDRYANCQAMADDLRRWLEGEPATARRMGFAERAVRWVRKDPKLAGAIATVAAVLLVSVVLVSIYARQAAVALREKQAAEEEARRAADTTLGALGTAKEERDRALEFKRQGDQAAGAAEQAGADAKAAREEANQDRERARRADAEAKLAREEAEKAKADAKLARDKVNQTRLDLKVADDEARQAADDLKLAKLQADKDASRAAVVQKQLQRILNPPLVLESRIGSSVAIRVNSACFGPNGPVIVAACDEGVMIWNTNPSAGPPTLIRQARKVHSLNFSRTGTQFVTVGEDKTAKVWKSTTLAELQTLKGKENEFSIRSASFNPNATQIVTACGDNNVRVWDLKSGKVILQIRIGFVNFACFSPDGTQIIAACDDKIVQIWDIKSKTEVLILKGHTDDVLSASFSPDGTRIVTTSTDKTARVWDAKTGDELLTLNAHTDKVLSASFSPDGTQIVTGSLDGTAILWDAKTGDVILTLGSGGAKPKAKEAKGPGNDSVTSACFSQDGTQIVVAHGTTAKVWRITASPRP